MLLLQCQFVRVFLTVSVLACCCYSVSLYVCVSKCQLLNVAVTVSVCTCVFDSVSSCMLLLQCQFVRMWLLQCQLHNVDDSVESDESWM